MNRSNPDPTPTDPPQTARRAAKLPIPLPDAAAIDFGASNTDAVAVVAGRLIEWTLPQNGEPDAVHVRRILAARGITPGQLSVIGVTGGHHRALPDTIDGCPIRKIEELTAIARGGQALFSGSLLEVPSRPLLVVSAGSGTAMVRAEGSRYLHVTGSGMGGGTLLGLGWLLLNSSDPTEIDRLASGGSANGADLALQDIVTGPIGALPPDATAVNFGRIVRLATPPKREDLAAALVNMVGQVIATLAINASRAAQVERIVVTGHLTDMPTMRAVMMRVGDFFGFPLELNARAGYATVTGALLAALGR